jgi:hypothetical protein
MTIGNQAYEFIYFGTSDFRQEGRRFFVYPDPMGSEENQFTPLGAGVNKLIFKRFIFFYSLLPIVINL